MSTSVSNAKLVAKSMAEKKEKEKAQKEDLKKMRSEILKEMNEKDMEIKELKEKILKLKVEKNMMDSTAKGVMNMGIIREEIKIADTFIKSVMKDNMQNYELISKMEEEDRNMVKKGKEDKKLKIKAFESDVLTKINFDNCKCATCIMNKNMVYSFLKRTDNSLVKNFNLTDKIFMSTHYDQSNLMLEVKNLDSKTKELVFKTRDRRSDLVRIKFFWRKEEFNKLNETKFNNHMEEAMEMVVNNTKMRISLSSYLVVKAMRETNGNPMEDLAKNKILMSEQRKFCFVEMFGQMMGKLPLNPSCTSMSDLIEEEEMALITNWGDREVFFKVHKGDMTSVNNHINIDYFEGSSTIKLYMLSTPMMRNINFFSDLTSEYHLVDINTDLEMEADETETENTMSYGTSIKENYEKSMHKGVIKNYGKIHGDFYQEVFLKRNRDKGFEDKKIKMLSESNLANNFLQSFQMEPTILMLANLSYKEFLAVLFFCKDNNSIVELVYNLDLRKMVNCVNVNKTMFIEMMSNNDKENVDSEKFTRFWKSFLSSLPNSVMFGSDLYKRMFWDFKKRIFQYITMRSTMREDQGDKNSMKSTFLLENRRNKDMDWVTQMYFTLYSDRFTGGAPNIQNYQPSSFMKEFKKTKLIEDDGLDVEESNQMMDLFLSEESLLKTN